MSRSRFPLVYALLTPAIAVAAAILGYYTWQTAAQSAQLGEEVIVQSTLLLVREKVDRMEQLIIRADNAVFGRIDLDDPRAIERSWPRVAAETTPSVRAVLVLDESGNVIAAAVRDTEEQKREFLKVIERILPDLELERQRPDRLKHFHRSYAGKSYLFSYVTRIHDGRRYYLLAHQDTGYLVREQFPTLFAGEQGKQLYNVVDETNRRVFGPDLARAGDYLVGRRFPTTLYGWRLQVAPKQAPLLDAQNRNRRVLQIALLATSFLIVVLGVAFILYAAAKERRVNLLRSDFVANVSHELKTPLSVILMFGEMLLSKRVRSEQKQQQYLEIICRESERLRALIDNVLDFAAVEHGKVRYELIERDLSEVIARAVDAFRHRFEQDRIELQFTRPAAPVLIEIDDQALLLAVMNLLDNAVKYGEGTPIDISVEVRERDVAIHVRDRGPGIPDGDLRRVFERFYRSKRERQEVRGSGIGLSLVEHIARGHGGRAWATNDPRGGAIVSMSMPSRVRTKEPALEAQPSERPAES